MRDEIIQTEEGEEGLAAELDERIYRFNVEATGIDDGRLLSAAIRDERGDLVAGITGWTWGTCGYVDVVWVQEDHRNQGLGTRLLDAAEDEARARGCVQIALATHTFQALDLYRRRGYTEYGRVENYPKGHAWVHLVKDLVP